MKSTTLRKLTFALVLPALLATWNAAHGQTKPVYKLSDASTASYYGSGTALDEIVKVDAVAGCDTGCGTKGGCDSRGDCCGSCGSCCGREPWRLFPTTCRGVDVYGWFNMGYTYNNDNPFLRFNGPVTPNDRDEEFQLNQTYLVVEKTTDPCGCGWQFGGRADLLYGTDARFTQATGLELGQSGTFDLNSGHRFYHLAFPQFYGEVRYNDWQLIFGHFYNILAYESTMAPKNFFYSWSYSKQYAEPFTFTGALLTWQATDSIQIRAGAHNGWNNFTHQNVLGAEDDIGFIGSVGWTGCGGRASLVAGWTWSRDDGLGGIVPRPGAAGVHDRNLISVVATLQLTDRLKYVFQHDAGWVVNSGIVEPAEWHSLNQYLFYTINDCWSAGLRAEWFRDDDAFRVAGIGNDGGKLIGWPFDAFSGDFYEVTAGLNWTPHPNIRVRPELRWDWFQNANIQMARVFDDDATGVPTRNNQFLAALDVIILW